MPRGLNKSLPLGAFQELPPALCRQWFGAGGGRYVRMGVDGRGSCFFHSACAILNVDGYMFKSDAQRRAIAERFRCSFAREWTQDAWARLRGETGSRKAFERASGDFCAPHVWADELAIRFASEILDANLVFLDARRGELYCGVHSAGALEAAVGGGGDASAGTVGGGGAVGGGAVDVLGSDGVVGGAGAAELGGGARARGRSQLPLTGVVLWTADHRHFEPVFRLAAVDEAGGEAEVHTALQPACNLEDRAIVLHLMRQYAASCATSPRFKRVVQAARSRGKTL
jgi:hypothetical protein